METSTPSDSLAPKLEASLVHLEELKDLFEGTAYQRFQEELAKVRSQLLDLAVATDSSVEAEGIRQQVKGLDRLRDRNFRLPALQDAGQVIDKPPEVEHHMALDSADRRRLHTKETTGSA